MLNPRRSRNSQRGMASIEIVPILLLFAMLFNFTLGFFGVIHTGILNGIAARNYAFETFRNRPNLIYLRDETGDNTQITQEIESRYSKVGYRFHGIISEDNKGRQDWIPTQRAIKFTEVQNGSDQPQGNKTDHTTLVRNIQSVGKVSDIFTGESPGDGKSGVNPVWLQTLYGICMNSRCAPMTP